ncbi:PBP1A family penicillin-binding protein [Devosia sp. XJ19-1]|uniref:PBP1A family penicillin-binding protein n=1 Tax=Devosia ureilytica TaxID=2952754 RepID=A0A9Q4FRQ8_9HYPH|nr:PBP1A family penicillin-binding protein [Devosia ureilytica]MCP8883155.1 PBP1A family penicillin-binding protein [Devosia ureilytica]MCP8886477.1 PBP1A family penicillin-binding protein [Devosia ureilytica]
MDFRISADDRVGAPNRRQNKPQARPAAKGQRVEPVMGQSMAFSVDAERPSGSGNGGGGKPPKGSRKPPRKGKAQPARQRRKSRSGGLLMGLLWWGFVACLWGGIIGIGIIVYYGAQLPASNTWAIPERPPNIRILAADGSLISNRGQTGGEAVTFRELPQYVPAAFIASEDRRFMSHFGVDPIGLLSVAIESVQAREVTRGASTLTQQVAKNLFLTPDQTLGRKVQEAILAVWLEQNFTKEEILELYMNRVYFGAGAYGIEAAAQTYFGVSARNLSLGQAAMLVGILPAPSAYNPKTNPDVAKDRQRLVLNAMAQEGYISAEEANAARINPDQTIRTVVAGSESYVADWVESLMTAYIGEIDGDVVVQTTIDFKMQKDAEFIVKEQVAAEGPKRGFTQGALVAMDIDGTVRAMVGGVDYQASQYNRAVTARRQPGSTFKPFVYLAAMEKGYTPDTLAEDAQFDYNGWSPRNASGKYAGTVTLRQGLAYSLNTIAARLAIDVTPEKVVEVAMRMGISSGLTPVPSIALGTQEVNLLELTSAYAPFANGGNGVIPNVITRISDVEGNVLYEASNAGPGRVIDPNVLAEMNDMLKTAVEVGTGRGANLGGWDFGGKTGTSQNARDALFVGYTSAMVTGVWLGNDNDTKTTLSGGNVPATIWSEFMTKAHEGRSPAPIPGGSYAGQLIAQQMIDPNTGMPLIDPATGQPQVQYVDGGTGQPVQTMTDPSTGQVFAIDPATGAPIEGLTPAGGQGINPPIQTGTMIDPATGLPVEGGIDPTTGQPIQQIDPNTGLPIESGQIIQYDGNGQAIDPVTGFPLQQPTNGFGAAPIDPETGLPMTLIVDPATGQQVWVPSAPTQNGAQVVPPGQLQQEQPVYQEERSQRTLMDLIFGN